MNSKIVTFILTKIHIRQKYNDEKKSSFKYARHFICLFTIFLHFPSFCLCFLLPFPLFLSLSLSVCIRFAVGICSLLFVFQFKYLNKKKSGWHWWQFSNGKKKLKKERVSKEDQKGNIKFPSANTDTMECVSQMHVSFHLNLKILKYLTFTFRDIDNGEVAIVSLKLWQLRANATKEQRHTKKKEEEEEKLNTKKRRHTCETQTQSIVMNMKNDEHNVDFKANGYAFKKLLVRSSLSLWI